MSVETMTAPVETPVPIETVTPIKPSEAIRLGCLTTGPAIGEWFRDGSTCALGAMMVGFGLGPNSVWNAEYIAFRDGPPLPVPGRSERFAPGAAVMILNDTERWPRERIADWLEGLGL